MDRKIIRTTIAATAAAFVAGAAAPSIAADMKDGMNAKAGAKTSVETGKVGDVRNIDSSAKVGVDASAGTSSRYDWDADKSWSKEAMNDFSGYSYDQREDARLAARGMAGTYDRQIYATNRAMLNAKNEADRKRWMDKRDDLMERRDRLYGYADRFGNKDMTKKEYMAARDEFQKEVDGMDQSMADWQSPSSKGQSIQ